MDRATIFIIVMLLSGLTAAYIDKARQIQFRTTTPTLPENKYKGFWAQGDSNPYSGVLENMKRLPRSNEMFERMVQCKSCGLTDGLELLYNLTFAENNSFSPTSIPLSDKEKPKHGLKRLGKRKKKVSVVPAASISQSQCYIALGEEAAWHMSCLVGIQAQMAAEKCFNPADVIDHLNGVYGWEAIYRFTLSAWEYRSFLEREFNL